MFTFASEIGVHVLCYFLPQCVILDIHWCKTQCQPLHCR